MKRVARRDDAPSLGLDALLAELRPPGRTLIEAAGPGASLLLAAMAARLVDPKGAVLWCANARHDGLGLPYGPALEALGIAPERLLLARCKDDREVAWALEEGLRTRGVAAAIGEIATLDLTQSRRLQLACERGGASGFLIRPRGASIGPIAAHHRWRAGFAPSDDRGPMADLGPPRLRCHLWRRRDGIEARFRIDVAPRSPVERAADPIPPTLVDMLIDRLGAARTQRLFPQASHQPGRADQWRAANEETPPPRAAWLARRPRPLRLLHAPEPATVLALAPDGPPKRLLWRGRWRRIIGADGAERIDPEWWRDPKGESADHYRIEDESGLRLWARRRGAATWHVMGAFL